jgi:hypothetical protein
VSVTDREKYYPTVSKAYNPYAPPTAVDDPRPPGATGEAASSDFYVVAPLKFWALYLATAGVYGLYWFYRNWDGHRRSTGERIWPVARALFAIFFVHRLFRAVDGKLRMHDRAYTWQAESLATGFVVATIIERLLDRLSSKSIGSPFTDIAAYVMIPVVGSMLSNAQGAINAACGDPEGASNRRFTALNILWLVLGAGILALAMVGTVLEFKS